MDSLFSDIGLVSVPVNLLILVLVGTHSNRLKDLSTRIDRMENRLNNVLNSKGKD